MSWPTASDVVATCQANGLQVEESVAAVWLNAAIAAFESMTGWHPFLADASPGSLTFDAPGLVPGFVLDMKTGFATVDSVSLNGSTLSADDYILHPVGSGYATHIQFLRHPGFSLQSIEVVGRRGRVTSVPPDVYQAVLMQAVAYGSSLAPALAASRIKQGQVEIEVGTRAMTMDDSGVTRGLRSVAMRYIRV